MVTILDLAMLIPIILIVGGFLWSIYRRASSRGR